MNPAERQSEIFDKIIKGMDKVYERLLEYKKSKNSVLVVIQDGKITKIKP